MKDWIEQLVELIGQIYTPTQLLHMVNLYAPIIAPYYLIQTIQSNVGRVSLSVFRMLGANTVSYTHLTLPTNREV